MVNGIGTARDEQATRLRAALEDLSGRDQRFEVTVGPRPEAGWWSAAVLVDPARGALPDRAAEYVRRRGAMTSDRVAASILTQTYANRVVGLGIGCWATERVVPVLAPDCVLLQFDGGRPIRTALRYVRAAGADGDALGALGDELFAGHLAHVVAGVRARTGLSVRRLWGNVATSCATAFVLLHRTARVRDRHAIRADALAFFAVREWPVHGLIDWHPTVGIEPLRFRRRTCCLFRLIPGETPCDTCPLPVAREDTTTL